jgi:hypothetical protein
VFSNLLPGNDSFIAIRCSGESDLRAVAQQWKSASAPPFQPSAVMS